MVNFRYAESYTILEEENKYLRTEIKDLKANLKINKEIIEGFFNSSSKKDQNTIYINKLKEENTKMNIQLEKVISERDEIRSKLTYIEQTSTETINRERDENEKNKNKIFIMDNALLKKDNLIAGLKKKIEKMTEEEKYSQYCEREIIVIEPSAAVTQIHDELLLYKQIYENLGSHIRENRDAIGRYETVINDLQTENAKLRTQIKLKSLTVDREKEKRIEEQSKSKSRSTSTNIESRHRQTVSAVGNNIKIPVNISKLRNKLTLEEDIINDKESSRSVKSFNPTEEWNEIMRVSGLTSEEMDKLARNKMLTRVIEAIEMLNRLLCDKNLQIRVLQKENDNLNKKNFELNKENINLFQLSLDLKSEIQKLIKEKESFNRKIKKLNHENTESSMINNTSKITYNSIKINSTPLKRQDSKINRSKVEFSTHSNGQRNISEENFGSEYKSEKLKNEYLSNYKEMLYSKFNMNEIYQNEGEDVNNTIEYKKNIPKTQQYSEEDYNSNCLNEEGSANDSIIYTKGIKSQINSGMSKDIKKENSVNKFDYSNNNKINNINLINKNREVRLGTLESCTSSEFRSGLEGYEGSFISEANEDIENLKIEIKHT